MSPGTPRTAVRPVVRVVARVVGWVLVAVWLLVWLAGRGLVWLAQVAGFVAGPVDELVTAWLGIAPVLPRIRRWRQGWCRQAGEEWRAYRAGAIEGEVMDGVWR